MVLKEWHFFGQAVSPVNTKLASKEARKLAIGVVCWVSYMLLDLFTSYLIISLYIYIYVYILYIYRCMYIYRIPVYLF